MTNSSYRVLRRFLAKTGVLFLPDFNRAIGALKGGNPGPMLEVYKRVEDLVAPEGNKMAPWFHALGTAKRNAIQALFRTLRVFESEAPSLRNRAPDDLLLLRWVRDFEEMTKQVRTLELASVAALNEDKSVERAGFLVHPMPGVTLAQTEDALDCLDAAVAKLKPVFPQVIYGDVFLSTHLEKGKAAYYMPGQDKFYLDIKAKKRFDDVFTIIHELGHRFDERFFKNPKLRNQFIDLSTRKVYETVLFDEPLRRQVAEELLTVTQAHQAHRPPVPLSPMALLWVKTPYTPGADIRSITTAYLKGTIDDKAFLDRVMGREDINVQTDKLLRGPLAVTPYGATKWTENFAEGFAHYVLGLDLPPELKAIYDQL